MGESKPLPLPAAHPADAGQVARLAGAFMIAIDRIRPDPAQPRRTFPETRLDDLTASVRERGIRQPLRVWHNATENVYCIVSGERRYRAALAAGLEQVPCILDRGREGTAVPDRTIILLDQIAENWQREDLNPYELSDALAELRDALNLTQDEIAKRLGKSKGEVSKLLSMQRIADDVQHMIRSAKPQSFSRRHISALARLPEEAQRELATRIRDTGMTAVAAEHATAAALQSQQHGDRRGGGVFKKEYKVGNARLVMTFRSRPTSKADCLALLDDVRRIVEEEA